MDKKSPDEVRTEKFIVLRVKGTGNYLTLGEHQGWRTIEHHPYIEGAETFNSVQSASRYTAEPGYEAIEITKTTKIEFGKKVRLPKFNQEDWD
jgi:hypothetical protein